MEFEGKAGLGWSLTFSVQEQMYPKSLLRLGAALGVRERVSQVHLQIQAIGNEARNQNSKTFCDFHNSEIKSKRLGLKIPVCPTKHLII